MITEEEQDVPPVDDTGEEDAGCGIQQQRSSAERVISNDDFALTAIERNRRERLRNGKRACGSGESD